MTHLQYYRINAPHRMRQRRSSTQTAWLARTCEPYDIEAQELVLPQKSLPAYAFLSIDPSNTQIFDLRTE